MTNKSLYHETLSRAADASLDYIHGVRDLPAHAEVTQAEVLSRLGTSLPETGEDPTTVVDAIIAASEGAIAPTTGGRFFGFVVGGSYPAGIAADWLSAAWDDTPGTPKAAPFGCAVDGLVGDWALDLLDLPRESSVGIVTGATVGNFVGIAAARNALLARAGWDVEANGLYGAPEIRVIVGEDCHPTLRLGLRYAGFGAERVIRIPTSDDGAMNAGAFAEAFAQSDGLTLVCSQAGHVNTGACDPFAEIGPLIRAHDKAWHHVDGAFGLWGRVTPSRQYLLDGVDLADSWSVDAHKWLNTPYDGAFAIVRDRKAHHASMSFLASYLPQQEGARDPSHFVPELSRRARGTAIYATIRHLGRQGVVNAIDQCCDHARAMAATLTAEPGIHNVNDVVLNQALFTFEPEGPEDIETANRLADAIAADVVTSGDAWVQTAEWRGRKVMRFSVCDHSTTADDIDRAAKAVIRAYRLLRAA